MGLSDRAAVTDIADRLVDMIDMMAHTGQDPILEVDALAEVVRLRAALERIAWYEGDDDIPIIRDPQLRGNRFGERRMARIAAAALKGDSC